MLPFINGFVLNSNFSLFLALSVSVNGWVRHKSAGFIVRLDFFIPLLKLSSLASFSLHAFGFSGASEPVLLAPRSASQPVSVCGPDCGDTSVGFLLRDHGSPVGPIERRKEYQLKGYEYLRAELFNNIRVGGPRDSQDESGGTINVTRHHKRHGRQECTV